MGSLNLVCPMCCGETFNNPQSLKYHLLSMTDNLYCPGCSQRSDSVSALIQHLDKCEQGLEYKVESDILLDKVRKSNKDPDVKLNILADVDTQQINQSFLATVNENRIVIMGDPQTIQVDENGEIKVVEKMDTEETQPDQNSLDFKISKELPDLDSSTQRRSESPQELMTIPITDTNANRKISSIDKNVITVLPENSELLGDSTTGLMNVDHINEVGELDEAGILRVKQELCEVWV